MSNLKKCLFAAMAAAALSVLAGCATALPCGAIYTGVSLPVSTNGSSSYSKVGFSYAKSVLGLVAWGDASVKAAAADGKISKIGNVDFSTDNVLGVYATYKTTVYGD